MRKRKSAYTLWLWRHSRQNESTEVKATHTCGAYVSLFQRRRLSKEKVSRVFFPLRFSFLFPRTFCVHWLIHSFIHSALFGLCVSRFSSAFGFSFMTWILFHFISRHRTQTVIPMLQPPPKEVASGSFGSFIKFSKSHLVLSRSFFFVFGGNRKGFSVALRFCKPAIP